ncbi:MULTISPECIES: MotA/TolQ/ExbB proton channel family protein [unclassified Campylobacter]|uniref:MotA/TolQ/ExbB proton channel family protein n=1 Tax=unclassified Campylobacter TaxID=2593542 RepID=UPI0022E9FD09|nr:MULTISPECIES: MotA/TolQ/ExbB proton channel family protein [unclassified Campylobacter]MDA3061615.1 MotA/TolQ/ExbB proton channel family protein [Campylobacter sp. JMF_14 EL1]MDA3073279.1 MotA/TolQ/ExbB proton channel family protein [Campylobacter sp. JMF_10 EL2]
MEKTTEILDLTLPENPERSLLGVYLKIVFVPVAIFAIFLLGFLKVIDFKVELHSIVMMGFLLIIALFLARHNAEFGCLKFQNSIENFKIQLKNYIVENLLSIGAKKKSDAKFENFVDEYSHSLRNDNYASVAVGVFPMLGILGTFISIAISMPNFSSSNIANLETEIAGLLGGVGTAFYVSIYGIFLALWWIYFEKKGISKFERLLLKYKNATKNFFWSKEEITQSYLSEILDRNAEVSRSFMAMASNTLSDSLNVAIDEKMQTLQGIIDAEQRALALTTSELERANEMILNANLTHGEISKNFDQILSSLKAVTSNMVEIQNGISAGYLSFSKSSEQKSANLQTSADALNQAIVNFTLQIKSLNENMLSEQINARESFKASFKELNDEIKSLFDSSLGKNTSSEGIIDELRKTLKSIDEKENQNEE